VNDDDRAKLVESMSGALSTAYARVNTARESVLQLVTSLNHREGDLAALRYEAHKMLLVHDDPDRNHARVVIDQAGDLHRTLTTTHQLAGEVTERLHSAATAATTARDHALRLAEDPSSKAVDLEHASVVYARAGTLHDLLATARPLTEAADRNILAARTAITPTAQAPSLDQGHAAQVLGFESVDDALTRTSTSVSNAQVGLSAATEILGRVHSVAPQSVSDDTRARVEAQAIRSISSTTRAISQWAQPIKRTPPIP